MFTPHKMRVTKALLIVVPVRGEAEAAELRRTIRPPLVLSTPTHFPGIAEIRGPRDDINRVLEEHRKDGWYLSVEWVERHD